MDTVSTNVVLQLCWTACLEVSLFYIYDARAKVTTSRTAVVLAPLFVHYEALFSLGLCKGVQKDLQNDAAKLKAEFRLKNKETEKD